MKKLIVFVLLCCLCSCRHYNPNGQMTHYIAITHDGDSIEVEAKSWEWDTGSVYFYTDDGDQFVSQVKHVIIKK